MVRVRRGRGGLRRRPGRTGRGAGGVPENFLRRPRTPFAGPEDVGSHGRAGEVITIASVSQAMARANSSIVLFRRNVTVISGRVTRPLVGVAETPRFTARRLMRLQLSCRRNTTGHCRVPQHESQQQPGAVALMRRTARPSSAADWLGLIMPGRLPRHQSESRPPWIVRKSLADSLSRISLLRPSCRSSLVGRELEGGGGGRQPPCLVVNQRTWGVDAGACDPHPARRSVDLA